MTPSQTESDTHTNDSHELSAVGPNRGQTRAPDEPTLHEVKATVCSACLDGEGAECHTPGCVYWLHDTPAFPGYPGQTLRQLIAGQGYVDGALVPLAAATPPQADGKAVRHG